MSRILASLMCVAIAAGLAGCGGGGEGAEYYIRYEVDGAPESYTELYAQYDGSRDEMLVGTASMQPGLAIVVPGATTGTFTLADGANVIYIDELGTPYVTSPALPTTWCSVTITSCGPVGGVVEGSFFAIVTDGSVTVWIRNGQFRAVRGGDV